MKPSIRKHNRIIKDDWLTFLYEEVLLYCENDSVDFSGYNLNKNPFLTELQQKHQFSLIDKMKDVKKGQTDTFYFTNSKGKIESFFSHLRNALAHNRIFVNPNDLSFIIEDKSGEKLTMYAEVSSFEKLKQIVTEIKKNYKE
jgi:hypothetical protein